ncbi:MAG: MATE family efflux transporter [Kiritimatiellae bacterium]|nr:MATE family efflux transporter [Kiritimatiellia bacterium]
MESLRTKLRKLSLPIFIEIALVMLTGAVDTFMLSSCGDGAVAAVGLDNQLVSLVFLVYQFVSVGAGIVCAQYHGARLEKRLVQVVGLAIVFNAILGIAASAFMFFRAEDILRLMGLRDELMSDGVTYLRITGALSFFQALGFTFSASLRSVDRVRGPMIVTIFANIFNAIGNYLLIFGHCGCPRMGVAGAAWATGASRIVSFALIAAIHTKVHIRRYPKAWFRPFPWREFRNLFKIGLPAMGEELSYCLSQVTITYFINQISTAALTTRTYAVNMIMFVYLFCVSVTQGGDILIGHLVGRRTYRPAYLMGNFLIRRSLAITLAGASALALAGPWIFSALTPNMEIIRLGTIILWIDLALEVGRVRNIFACGTLRAAGDPFYPLAVGIIFQWGVAVGVAWLFAIPFGWGLIGAWIAFAIDENLRGVILMKRWNSLKWTGKSLA